MGGGEREQDGVDCGGEKVGDGNGRAECGYVGEVGFRFGTFLGGSCVVCSEGLN